MLYKKSFGDDFELGFPLWKYNFLNDRSYHNDVCPSFWFEKNKKFFILWVDIEDEKGREMQGKRYTVTKAFNFGDDSWPEIGTDENSITTFESDDFSLVMNFIESIQPD